MKLSKTIPNPLADCCQRLLFSIAFVASCTIGAIGQSLVTEISSTTANLTSQEALAFQTLQQDTFTKNVKLVSFGNPTDFMDNGEMTFTLPGIEGTIVAKVIDIVQTDTSMGWVGRLTNQNGFLAIHETHGLRGAWIQAGHRFFEIMPIKEGVNTLREINGDIGDAVDCIAPEIGPSERSVDFCAEDYNTCGASIDILVLVPQDVRDWLVSRLGYNPFIIAIYVALGTYSINAAFINSDIPNKQVNIMYEAFNYVYPSPLNCQIGLNGGPSYAGLSTQAATRRAATGADLVVLLTSRDFPCGAGVAEGNPSDGGHPAFALVEINWLIHPRWTFLHEVGHLLSARHSRSSPGPGDDDSSDCGHGWTVDANRFQRTLMAPWFGTTNPTDIRVLHFSNPAVDYPIGSSDPSGTPTSDNAKSIRNAACSVGNYMSAFLRVRISGPAWVCYNESYINVSAVIQPPTFGNPGVGPYTNEWRWSYTGDFANDPSYLFGTGASAQLAVPPPGVDDIWIRLKVTSSDNVVIYEYRDIGIFGPDDHHCDNFQGGGGNFLMASPSLSPNPASNEITLSVLSEYEKYAEIVISNITGNAVFELNNQYLSKGKTQFRIDVGGIPTGIYTLSILSESNIESVKFIINR